jgi:TonB-dependent receptor
MTTSRHAAAQRAVRHHAPVRINHHAAALRPRQVSLAVALALVSLVGADPALAQEAGATADAAAAVSQVTVVGTRASQQSAIERKKNAATAIDSIVAEDVGALPDRNVGEAISRMAGIALDRGDFGEGVSVAVRGNGPDLTRVELDGQAVQSAGGADGFGGSGSGATGRSTEFRQLSADLIKSVDVVKGSTADQVEGSLGGGIRIQTRTGLDFKKPFVSLRVAASQNSLNKIWEPDANLILSNKFMNGRLGVLLNTSVTTLANEAHSVQPSNAARAGYYRLADFDNSPEKTFTFQPQTVNKNDTAATTPLRSDALIAGGVFNSGTPLDIITKSAAAKTKADCYTAFPVLTATESAAINQSARGAAQSQRINELITCLNQWNDYTPSNIRNFVRREFDKRQNVDLRLDFKVNNNLTVYAKGSYNRRYNDSHQLTYTEGNVKVNPSATTAIVTPTYNGVPYVDNTTTGTRTVMPGSGYYLYNTPTIASNAYISQSAADIIPSSIVTDAAHHLTQFTITDAGAVTDQLHNHAKTIARYGQLGGTWKKGPWNVEFFVGDANSYYELVGSRMALTDYYGPVTMSVLPNGLWSYSAPAGSKFDQGNPAEYAVAYPGVATGQVKPTGTNPFTAPAYTVAQQPLSTQKAKVDYNPRVLESEERTAKLDVTWATPESIPFLTRFKSGFNLRDNIRKSWDPNNSTGNKSGYTIKAAVGTLGTPGYIPEVTLPGAIYSNWFVGCQDTPGSLAPGGNRCQYGYAPNTDVKTKFEGTTTMTVQQFQNFVGQILNGKAATQFFSGAKNRPSGLLNNWTALDVDKTVALLAPPNFNMDCLKSCVASDGNVYQQPFQRLTERTEAFYLMGDFKIDENPLTHGALPFGWEITGNAGYRYVRNTVRGNGMFTVTSVTAGPSYSATNTSDVIRNSVTTPVSIEGTSHDFLPSYNLAMWVVPDKLVTRYSWGKTVARPPITSLLPAGSCTYDATLADRDPSGVHTCSQTLGNPELRPQTNVNQNLSFEWYPNKDTMFTIAGFKQEGKIGPSIAKSASGAPIPGGAGLVDPTTGTSLTDIPFNYSVWQNDVPTTRKGVEFSTKTAFTFLPWRLRYTGFDANYTKLRSVTSTQNIVDLLTGEPLPPVRESKYTYNYAVWYDDGKLSARIAVQAVATSFSCLAGCTSLDNNNYPAAGTAGLIKFPYNPGSPNFKDATRYIDGKISYKLRPNIEVFVEGRNLGNATTSNSQGKFGAFANGTPNLLDYAYAGRRIMIGLNYRNL